MEQYEVYYKDVRIGELFINNEYKYLYKPNLEGVKRVKDEICLLKVMEKGTDEKFVKPIPFFQERIRYMKLWRLSVIGYHTDYFVIKQIR